MYDVVVYLFVVGFVAVCGRFCCWVDGLQTLIICSPSLRFNSIQFNSVQINIYFLPNNTIYK